MPRRLDKATRKRIKRFDSSCGDLVINSAWLMNSMLREVENMVRCPYDFKAINPTDYELEIMLTSTAHNRMIRSVIEKTVKELQRLDKDGTATSKWELGEEKDIPESAFPKIKMMVFTGIHKNLIDIKRQIGVDGVRMLSKELYKCTFIKTGREEYAARIIITGSYVQTASMPNVR